MFLPILQIRRNGRNILIRDTHYLEVKSKIMVSYDSDLICLSTLQVLY